MNDSLAAFEAVGRQLATIEPAVLRMAYTELLTVAKQHRICGASLLALVESDEKLIASQRAVIAAKDETIAMLKRDIEAAHAKALDDIQQTLDKPRSKPVPRPLKTITKAPRTKTEPRP